MSSKYGDPAVMQRGHPRWVEFLKRLTSLEEGCGLKREGPVYRNNKCDGTHLRPLATKILQSMEGVDVEASLKWIGENGGSCDCEILFHCAAGPLVEV